MLVLRLGNTGQRLQCPRSARSLGWSASPPALLRSCPHYQLGSSTMAVALAARARCTLSTVDAYEHNVNLGIELKKSNQAQPNKFRASNALPRTSACMYPWVANTMLAWHNGPTQCWIKTGHVHAIHVQRELLVVYIGAPHWTTTTPHWW